MAAGRGPAKGRNFWSVKLFRFWTIDISIASYRSPGLRARGLEPQRPRAGSPSAGCPEHLFWSTTGTGLCAPVMATYAPNTGRENHRDDFVTGPQLTRDLR